MSSSWALHRMTAVFIRDREGGTETQGKSCVKKEVEIGGVWPQAESTWRRKMQARPCPRASGGCAALPTP